MAQKFKHGLFVCCKIKIFRNSCVYYVQRVIMDLIVRSKYFQGIKQQEIELLCENCPKENMSYAVRNICVRPNFLCRKQVTSITYLEY